MTSANFVKTSAITTDGSPPQCYSQPGARSTWSRNWIKGRNAYYVRGSARQTLSHRALHDLQGTENPTIS